MLVTAVILLSLMMGVALSAYAFVDQQQGESAIERVRESSFNVSEALMGSQVFILSRRWPGNGLPGAPYPANCTTGVTDTRCPDSAGLFAAVGGPDVNEGVTWSTMVRDNTQPNPNYYDDTVTASNPSWDANLDGKLWVRAQASMRGRRRTLVGLVQVEKVQEDFPKSALVAGRFGTTNNGRKVIVDTQGDAAAAAPVQVRCLVRAPGCLDYPPNKDQIKPDTTELGYTGGPAMAEGALDRMRERAIADGTYHPTCPANPSGAVVFVETGNCAYSNSASPCCNSTANPGVLIIANGTLNFSGNNTFHGVIHMPNLQNSNGWVVTISGTALVRGAIAIDGAGGLLAGTSAMNLSFNPNVFAKIVSYGNAGIIQNTWREIPAAAPAS